MIIEIFLVIGIVIVSIVWHFQAKRRWRAREAERERMLHTMGLEVLANRYARGEISREEYLEKRGDIIGYPPAVVPPVRSRAA